MKKLQFAESHQGWNEEWQNIVWSDDKKWNLDGPDGKSMFWHDNPREKPIAMKCHSGGGSLMVWGAFSYRCKTELCTISGNQDSVKYQRIFPENLLSV